MLAAIVKKKSTFGAESLLINTWGGWTEIAYTASSAIGGCLCATRSHRVGSPDTGHPVKRDRISPTETL
jgi:hypothetical protein